MSNNIVPLKTIRMVDPLVDLKSLENRTYAALDGGSDISWQVFQASSVSNSSITINCNPPDEKTFVDGTVYAKVTYRLVFAGVNTIGGNLIQVGVTDAPRAFPFSQTISTMTCTMNGNSLTTNLSQYHNALMHYGPYKEKFQNIYSATPCQLDDCVEYSALHNTNRSPFRLYGDNVIQEPRGSFSGIVEVANAAAAATFDLTVYEPVFMPGLIFSKHGLINLRTMSFTFNFGSGNSGINRVWSHNNTNGNTVNSVSTTITGFELWFKYVSPKILSEIPKQVVYSWSDIIPVIQQGNSVLAGATATLNMSAINLSAIPKMVYVYARRQDSDLSFDTADGFFGIEQITLNYGNRTGLLASMSQQALWQESVKNGSSQSWSEFSKYVGSIVCLRFGTSIGLTSLEAPGLLKNPILSMQVRVKNLSSGAVTPQLFVQIVTEGCITISEGTLTKSSSVLTSTDILKTQIESAQIMEYHHDENQTYLGGDLLQDAGRFVKSLVETVDSGIKVGAQVAPLIGLGGKKGKGLTGGELVGGKGIDRSQLKKIEADLAEY